MHTNNAQITITVLYALVDYHFEKTLEIDRGSTVAQALSASEVYLYFPEIQQNAIGIWGKICTLATELHHLDRVEIYRPLQASLKLHERAAAQQNQQGNR